MEDFPNLIPNLEHNLSEQFHGFKGAKVGPAEAYPRGQGIPGAGGLKMKMKLNPSGPTSEFHGSGGTTLPKAVSGPATRSSWNSNTMSQQFPKAQPIGAQQGKVTVPGKMSNPDGKKVGKFGAKSKYVPKGSKHAGELAQNLKKAASN